MKQKIATMTAALFTLCFHLSAQKIYFGFGTGYNYPAAPNHKSESIHNIEKGTNTYERVKGSGSFGRGFTIQGFGGYTFKPNLSFELTCSYLVGSRIKSSNHYSNEYVRLVEENTLAGRMFRIIPALKFYTGIGNIRPYMKVGAVVGFGAKLMVKSESQLTDLQNPWANEIYVIELEFKGRASVGFTSSIGADFKLGKRISLFGEINLMAQSWAPARSVITKANYNGIDFLSDMDTYDKETEYVDFYTIDDQVQNPDKPAKDLKSFAPFSSVGLHAGLIFRL